MRGELILVLGGIVDGWLTLRKGIPFEVIVVSFVF